MDSPPRFPARRGASRGSLVAATLLLVFIVFVVWLTLYAIREVDASYQRLEAFLDRSVRAILRNQESLGGIALLRWRVHNFLGKQGRIDAPAAIRLGDDEFESLLAEHTFSLPLSSLDKALLSSGIEGLEARLEAQRASLRSSFDALMAGVNAALLASLVLSAWLWQRQRLSRVESAWRQKSMRQALFAEEETRGKIARDLHDDLIQDIAAARMLCDRSVMSADAEAAKRLGSEAAAILEGTGKRLRGLVHDIRPPDLERLGLLASLESLCARNESLFGKAIGFHAAEMLPRLDDEAALQTYRIVQEAVTNSLKHASGGRLEVRIEPAFRAGGRGLHIEVEDGWAGEAGRPAPLDASPWGGMGLSIMRERASYIGARIELERRGGGLAVSIFVPADERRGGEHA